MKTFTRFIAAILCFFMLLFSHVSYAISFSPVIIKSGYGEPLLANIDIHDAKAGEILTFYASIGSSIQYDNTGLIYSNDFDDLKVFLLRTEDDKPFLKLVGKKPLSNNKYDLLLDFYWHDGHYIKIDSFELNDENKMLKREVDKSYTIFNHAVNVQVDKGSNRYLSMDAYLSNIDKQIAILKKELYAEKNRLDKKNNVKENSSDFFIKNKPEIYRENNSMDTISYEELNRGKVKTPENQKGSLMVVKNEDKGRIPNSAKSIK